MTRPSRSTQKRLDNAIFGCVEAVLDDFFDDPDEQARYKKLVRGGRKTGPKLGEIVPLGTFAMSDDGEFGLAVRVGSPEIVVTMTHPRFSAETVVHYNVGTATMTEARIDRFDGDRKQAARLVEIWFDDLVMNALDADGQVLDPALAALLPGDGSPFDEDNDPGEPPPPTARDEAMVGALAKALTREMKRKKPDMMAHEDGLLELERVPQALWPILEGTIAACITHPRDEAAVSAWQFLLETTLTLIRYRIDRGWDWAVRMVDEYQRKLIEIGHAKLLSPEDFAALSAAMGEAGVEVKPGTRQALAEAGLTLPGSDRESAAELPGMMRTLIDQLAATVTSPFDMVDVLDQATGVMPSEMRCFMAHEFAHSRHAILRDTVPLLLLSAEREVRQAAADALKQTAAAATMSPEALRRMIAIRNWVPPDDRPSIDQAVRQARTNGVECAQWPPDQDLMITTSFIDGSGAQNLILTSRGTRKGILAGALLKLATGIADTWCDSEASRRDINETLTTLRRTGASCEVDRTYLDTAVQHAIAIGTTNGRPPGGTLLRIAEFAGGANWRDHRLDIAAEAKRLFDSLPDDQRTAVAIEGSLARSGQWIDEDFAESWFLDDAATRVVIKGGPRRDKGQLVKRLMAEVMPERRAEWAERFLLSAARAGAAKDPAHKAYINDFTILAHSLCEDRDLSTMPLMVAIAHNTVEISRIARW